MVGAAYLAGKLDVIEEWARGLNRLRILSYLDFRLNTGGMINGKHLMKTLEEHLGGLTLEGFDRRFMAIATDLATGHEAVVEDRPPPSYQRRPWSVIGG